MNLNNKNRLYLMLLSIIFVLTACQGESNSIGDDPKSYKIAIFGLDSIMTFNEKNGKLELEKAFKRSADIGFWNEGFVETNDFYVAKTKEDKQFKSYVATIDKKSLKENFVSAEGNDVYTSTTDGDYYYATAVFGDRIEFYKYDLSLKVVSTATIHNAETINASNQFVVIGDELYLLVSQVVVETGLPQMELWRMDKEFGIQEKINLEESNPYLRMTCVGQKLYLTEAFNGKTEEGYLGGDQILVYDLATRSKEYIQLSTSYPRAIYHDPVHNNLIIGHESTYLSGVYWTLYNLDSGKETTVSFPEINPEDSLSSFFTMRKGRYYFLFDKNLIEVDGNGMKIADLDLKQYNIQSPHAVLIND